MVATRILIADDSTPIQKVIKIAFAKHPIDFVITHSLVESESEVQRTRPQLIIIDAGLPGTSEPQDFLKITRNGEIPAIILLGSYERFKEEELRSQGFQHLLRKPFDGKELVRVAESLLPESFSPPIREHASPPPPPIVQKDAPGIRFGSPVFNDSVSHQNTETPKTSVKQESTLQSQFHSDISHRVSAHQNGREPVEDHIKRAVEEYCEKHFKSIARDVITQELRRLAEEKSRILSDS